MQRVNKLSGTNIRWSKSKDTGVWSITLRTEHGDRTISTGESDKRKATEMVRELRLQWHRTDKFQKRVLGAISGCRKISVDSAIKLWAESKAKYGTLSDRSVITYCNYLRAFAKHSRMEKEQPVLITGDMIYEWVNHAGKANTRRIRLAILKLWFKWMICERYVVTDHPGAIGKINMSLMDHEQMEPARKPPFTAEQFAQLIAHIEELLEAQRVERNLQLRDGDNCGYSIPERIARLKFWIVASWLGWLTGLRIGDVCQLEHASLRDLVVHTDKSETRIVLEMTQQLKAAIQLIERRDEQYCFPDQRVRYLSDGRSSLSAQFTDLCAGAGLPGHSFHSMRRSHAHNLQAEGKTTPEIAKALGHRDEKVTQVYLNQGTT